MKSVHLKKKVDQDPAAGLESEIKFLREQNTILQAIVDQIPEAVFGKDGSQDLRFCLWNKTAESLWGIKRSDVIGKSDSDFFPKEQAEFFKEKDRQAIREGRRIEIPIEHLKTPKGDRILKTVKFPLNINSGEKTVLLGYSKDITDVHETEQQLQLCVESVRMGMWKWHIPTNALSWDRNMYQLYGLREKDFSGAYEAWESAVHPDDKQRAVQELQLAVEGKKEFNTKFRIVLPSKVVRHINAKGAVERDTSGAPIWMTGLNWDITDLEEQAQLIEDQKLKLAGAAQLKALGEMAGGVAHEINNPLAVITGKVEQLRRRIQQQNFDVPKAVQDLDKISSTCERIVRIVKGLKYFSRTGEGDPFSIVALDSLLLETLSLCHERFKSSGVELKIEGALTTKLECRPVQIGQVLLNLLNNAFDAVADTPDPWVKVRVDHNANSVQLAVIDSGKGIPADIAAKIMQPFFTTKEIGKGTGLGLSISFGIIQDHGGRLLLDQSCRNTRFVIELPQYQKKKQEKTA